MGCDAQLTETQSGRSYVYVRRNFPGGEIPGKYYWQKRKVLVLIELFSLGLGVTAEALREIIGSKSAISFQRRPVDPKFQVEGVAPPPTILLLRKLGFFRMI